MTEQPLTGPGAGDAEAVMNQAASDLRTGMDRALANLRAHGKRIADLATARLDPQTQPPDSPNSARPT